MASQPPASSAFERKLVQDGGRKIIESTCLQCGLAIVGSVSDGIADKELDHLRQHGVSARTDGEH